MGLRKIIGLVALAILLSACSNGASSGFSKERFIEDTEEVVSISKNVYYNMRRPTTEEDVTVEWYQNEYGEIEDLNISAISSTASLLYLDAHRLVGMKDTFAENLKELETYIEEYKER
ncbi:MAG: hypothetical protein ACQEXB_24645 [Bacillota bacterium]